MPSQDDNLDKLLKRLSEEEKEDTESRGNAAGRPNLEEASQMTEEEIAKLLAAGSEETEKSSKQKDSGSDGDVHDLLEGSGNSVLQEVKELLEKAEKNEAVNEDGDSEENGNPADKLLAEIDDAENAAQGFDAKQQRALEKKRKKEEKLAKKEAKKAEREAAKAAKSGKSGKGKKTEAKEADADFDKEALDRIMAGAEQIGQGEQPPKAGKKLPEDTIIEIEAEEADDLLPDITPVEAEEEGEEPEEPEEKKGIFAKFVAFLMEEDEEEKDENEDMPLSKENQEIIDELDKEKAKEKGGKGKKAKKAKKEKPKKGPKPKKAPKPKKEKPKKEEEPVAPGSRLTLKKVLPIVLLGASVGAVVFIFSNVSMDYADKQVAADAYREGDYETCYQNLFGKRLNEEQALMYGKSESILYITLRYRDYERFLEEGNEVKALDCLIQIVSKYPELYEYANQWNAVNEVNQVYSLLLNDLTGKYGITEAQALEIAAVKSDLEYTRIVTALALGMPYDSWNGSGNTQQPVDEGLHNVLPEESDIEQGNFVNNQNF